MMWCLPMADLMKERGPSTVYFGPKQTFMDLYVR